MCLYDIFVYSKLYQEIYLYEECEKIFCSLDIFDPIEFATINIEKYNQWISEEDGEIHKKWSHQYFQQYLSENLRRMKQLAQEIVHPKSQL